MGVSGSSGREPSVKERIFLERDRQPVNERAVGEGRTLCRIIFHLLEDPSAPLCTHDVRCAPHYRYPGGEFIYLPSAVLYLGQT